MQLTEGATGVEEVFPRFTMVGGDFETVRGEWGIRGEVAGFVEDSFQAVVLPGVLEGRSMEGGMGVDRRAGDFRVSGNVLVRRRFVDQARVAAFDRHDVNLIASLDRSSSRETRTVQVFGVYDPTEATSFLRGIVTVKLTDQLSVEASGGVFSASGPDTLGLFSKRDFACVRVKRDF